ncbi:DUF5391 family protein [Bacillus testis]|uniref:DUF5391 family protein n=1 Tax=Bacillus testis TaxID=1622072 RepID=UPI00067F2F9C|nr:DUF5391 family protein [Bacillus testis]
MKKRIGILTATFLSAILFCALLTITSMSPLAETGKHANQFGSVEMWMELGMVLLFYLFPLIIYTAGLRMMKFVLALFCGIGLLANSFFLVFALIMAEFKEIGWVYLTSIIGLCIAGMLVHFIWFLIAFRPSSSPKETNHPI